MCELRSTLAFFACVCTLRIAPQSTARFPIHSKRRRVRIAIARLAVFSVAILGTGICLLGLAAGHALAQDGAAANAAPAATDVDRNEIRRLLRDLEAPQVQQRDAAEKKLVEYGPAVLEFLPSITARTPGELKIRLQRIRQAFESQSIERFFEASLVTLAGKMPLTEAVHKIAEQTGNPITLQGEEGLAGVDIELDAQEEPFWAVMDKVITQGGLRIVTFGTTDRDLVLAAGARYPEQQTSAFFDGPFRVEPAFVQATRNFNSQLRGQLQVSLQVTWEPRVEPVFMQIPMSSVQARLPNETSIEATNRQAAPEIPLNYGGCTTQVDLQLELPERQVSTIEELQGEFVVAVPGESHRFEFDNFANGARQSQKYGDLSVVLEGARRNGQIYEVRLLIQFGDPQGALDSYRGWVMSNKAYVLDPQGRRLDDVGLNTYAMTNSALGVAYLFSIGGDPSEYKLVYEAPSTISKQTVRYRLNEIALP